MAKQAQAPSPASAVAPEIKPLGPLLHIVCLRPGLIRGGISHPHHASHALTDFTAAQLREMQAEPALVLLLGHVVNDADLAALEPAVPPAAGPDAVDLARLDPGAE